METRIEPAIGIPPTALATDTKSRGSLLRVLGVGFGLAVIIGNTLGAGILRNPAVVASQLPVAWMFIGVWIVGGLYALLGSFAVSELSAMLPRAGGYFVFARSGRRNNRVRTHSFYSAQNLGLSFTPISKIDDDSLCRTRSNLGIFLAYAFPRHVDHLGPLLTNRPRDSQLFHFGEQCGSFQSEFGCCTARSAHHPASFLKRFLDQSGI